MTRAAVICPGYQPPRRAPNGRLHTCTGIVIGGAVGPKSWPFSADADLIQEALLEPRTATARPLLARIAGALVGIIYFWRK